MDAKKTGELIANLRKEKGLSQIDFANQLNISNRTVSKWENGDGFPDITLLPEIAKAFDITTDELLAGELKTVQANTKPEFICQYTQNQTDLKNALKVIRRKRLPISYIIILGIAIVFLFVFSILFDVSFGNIASKILFIFYIFCILLYFLLPIIHAKTQLKNRLSVVDEKFLDKRVEFSDKMYGVAGNGDCSTYEYAKITDVMETKDLFVLNFSNKMFAYVRKDSFIVGKSDDFLDFIMPKITPSKNNQKLKAIRLITISALSVVLIISASLIGIQISNLKVQYGYKDIETKVQYFEDNKKEFEKGLQKVQKDENLRKEVEEYQYAVDYADEYIALSDLCDVEVTDDSVSFTAYNSDYYCGYVKYSGKEDVPYPKEVGFAAEKIDSENFNYLSEDDVYLLGRNENNMISVAPWFMIKEIGDDWYYYEYHSLDELSTP